MDPGLTVVLALSVMTSSPVQAQDDGDRCRCADGDGNEIENYTCFQMPRMDRLVGAMAFGTSRPRLGISIDASQAASQDAQGAVVADVLEGGPADEAGLRKGDVVTTLDGQSLIDPIGAAAYENFDLDESVTA
jgi:C-terminal processing protease CtpA/Prc